MVSGMVREAAFRNRWRRIKAVYGRHGLARTVSYIWTEGLVKRMQASRSYRAYAGRYPQTIIFIAAFPKSGSSWIRDMFASLHGFAAYAPSQWNTSIPTGWDEDRRWDLYPGIFNEFDKKLTVIRGHTRGDRGNTGILDAAGLKYIVTIRDPRDRLISEYWHSRNFPGQWQSELAHRLSLEEFISYKLESGEFRVESLGWLESWLPHRDKGAAHFVRYEEMLQGPQKTFGEALAFMGFEVDSAIVDGIVSDHSFERATGRVRGRADDSQFQRKGVAGEWREIFSAAQNQQFLEMGAGIIRELGYAATMDAVN